MLLQSWSLNTYKSKTNVWYFRVKANAYIPGSSSTKERVHGTVTIRTGLFYSNASNITRKTRSWMCCFWWPPFPLTAFASSRIVGRITAYFGRRPRCRKEMRRNVKPLSMLLTTSGNSYPPRKRVLSPIFYIDKMPFLHQQETVVFLRVPIAFSMNWHLPVTMLNNSAEHPQRVLSMKTVLLHVSPLN